MARIEKIILKEEGRIWKRKMQELKNTTIALVRLPPPQEPPVSESPKVVSGSRESINQESTSMECSKTTNQESTSIECSKTTNQESHIVDAKIQETMVNDEQEIEPIEGEGKRL